MRTALIALVASGAMAAAAVPALAQTYDTTIAQRETHLRERIENSVANGALTRDQAGRLSVELRQITDLDARYQAEGMSDDQQRDLNSRLSLLASRVNYDLSVHSDGGD